MTNICEWQKKYNHKKSSVDISKPKFNTVKKTLEAVIGHTECDLTRNACEKALHSLNSAVMQIESEVNCEC